MIECPVSIGELVDKISVLKVKIRKINDEAKLKNLSKELGLLEGRLASLGLGDEMESYLCRLEKVNEDIWDIIAELKDLGRFGSYNDRFVHLSVATYESNDLRFLIKREINERFNSELVEEKTL